jgi:hypothetical protein
MFYRAEDKDELAAAYTSIATSTEQILSFDASSILLILTLLFFFVEWLLTNTKYRTLP